jgi:phage terminase small subunit
VSAPLSERERRFVEAYMGEAAGNATKAAELAGYSKISARQQGARLCTKAAIRAAIDERTAADPQIADRTARQRLWSDIAFGRGAYADAALKDRLKASELLGKSQADFIERHEHSGQVSLVDLLGAGGAE